MTLRDKYDELLEKYEALQELLAERDVEIEGLYAKLIRAHRLLVADLDALYPDMDTSVEELKARVLGDVQRYLEG